MATVLVIEDDDLVRNMLVLALEFAGHKPVAASDGEAGVRLFEEVRPDLVLTDIVMPDTDGFEAIRQILAIEPGARIVAMTGTTLLSKRYYLRIATKLGAMAGLVKPFSIDDLVGLIHSCLGLAPA